MSNNARVVAAAGAAADWPADAAGGEIGSAQYFQALAARATPDVCTTPIYPGRAGRTDCPQYSTLK